MKILVACEYSGIVRDSFRSKGHNAWSCDLLPTEIKSKYHIQGDVLELLEEKWDMIIAFPPCTNLAISGARYFKRKIEDGRQQQGINFFMKFVNANCPRIAIENPVGIMSTIYRRPDQIIQPYYFGEPESKRTCLWLKNIPLLKPTNVLNVPSCGYWNNQDKNHQNKLNFEKSLSWNNELTAHLRSKTYKGIAAAMAEQWSNLYYIQEKLAI